MRMSFKSRLAQKTGLPESILPGSYQIIGRVMLLKMLKVPPGQKRKIAKAIMELYPYVKTVCELSGIKDEFRTPKAKKLAGNGTITTHKEHGILYRLDASRIMFSKGNHYERKRLISQIKAGEIVVDMFAGIGYFSLGIAKHSKAKKIYSIEKNPLAYRYLKQNIVLNKIKNTEPLPGDNRTLAGKLEGKADRIIMGYFQTDRRAKGASGGSEKFLPYAVKMLKSKGTIHFHNSCHKKDLWKKPAGDIERACAAFGASFRLLNKKKVKSVAPNTYHVVLDIEVAR